MRARECVSEWVSVSDLSRVLFQGALGVTARTDMYIHTLDFNYILIIIRSKLNTIITHTKV